MIVAVSAFLSRVEAEFPAIAPVSSHFCYILSDITQRSIDGYKAQPQLQPYIQQGLIDFAVLDAENLQHIYLQHTKHTLAITNNCPVLVIANYVFDSLSQDAFRVHMPLNKQQLTQQPSSNITQQSHSVQSLSDEAEVAAQEGSYVLFPTCIATNTKSTTNSSFTPIVSEWQVSTRKAANDEHSDGSNDVSLQHLDLMWTYKQIDVNTYYDNPLFSQLLRHYIQQFSSQVGSTANNSASVPFHTFVFPVGAMKW